MRVDLLAVSTLPVRLSMYWITFWRRCWLRLVKKIYSSTVTAASAAPSRGDTVSVTAANRSITTK